MLLRTNFMVRGRFDVTIQMDSKYCIGATGLLQNQENMGYGYSSSELKENQNPAFYCRKCT